MNENKSVMNVSDDESIDMLQSEYECNDNIEEDDSISESESEGENEDEDEGEDKGDDNDGDINHPANVGIQNNVYANGDIRD
ncbi:hypothetical protein WICANDRAFT_62842 [Wickerhamomyces anomalus NRRL Y-366-8]|uniref:Uncharacterized protein n=1 Tax=Wickerhamomyces anomalus (strain ATCC 58044 / CBS 1984 / NCYC 433 / NRRL Y-366-8) TaxID=683960 RepID=A0A1E3P5Z9_WICAA|nr:uncharacterized protein WICANDRAFT_62842 [Wickerhamomyces anomalus NRRL Y-366-8]ODQ60277.1 hypothetical protein WICANDRAFT_62842 [Wickerhamomyces anomalus NRRL Y-366-8]